VDIFIADPPCGAEESWGLADAPRWRYTVGADGCGEAAAGAIAWVRATMTRSERRSRVRGFAGSLVRGFAGSRVGTQPRPSCGSRERQSGGPLRGMPQMAGQAGTAAKTDRPGLLIALVSRDVIVLAKLVRTLCPRQVLLFWTAGARDGGWTEGATELLKGLQEHRPEVLQGFRVIDLRSVDCPSKLDWFRRTIDDGVNRIQEDVEAVVFDCRTGQSIFHVLGFDAIRPIGLERGVELSAVYIDADTRSIVRSTARGGGIEYHQQHTAFRYESGKELVERFGIYGFVPRGALRLCPNPPDPVGYDGLCELYDALCRDKGLRALFHSYWLKLYRWKQRKIAAGADCAVDIPALMRGALVRIAAWVSRQTNQAGQQVPARYALAQALDDLVPAGSAVAWLDHYLSDRKLSALKRKLHQYAESLGQQLLTGRAFGQRLSDFAQGLPREFKTLVALVTIRPCSAPRSIAS